jgi:site-specific recombinase XerC
MAERTSLTDARTVNRELSALRCAVGWWQDQGWIGNDPTIGLRHVWPAVVALPTLTDQQLAALWRSQARLREHAFWHLLYDSTSPAPAVLALDASDLDLERCRSKVAGERATMTWTTRTPLRACSGGCSRPQERGRFPVVLRLRALGLRAAVAPPGRMQAWDGR